MNDEKSSADSAWALSIDLLSAKALVGGGVDGPPYAAAMAMPRPSRFIRTHAVSRNRFPGPDDAA